MTVWFTSDPHWGHGMVARLRGFGDGGQADRANHDEVLLTNFLEVVDRRDQVWWLGDLCIAKPDYALEQIAKIPGKHHLVCGNHDRVSPINRDSHRYMRQYMEVFTSVQAYARRRISGQQVLLSHYPYITDLEAADHTDIPRYTQYRLPDEGSWLLHGHTHNASQRQHGRQIHVGLDAWGLGPVTLDTIQQIITHHEKEQA